MCHQICGGESCHAYNVISYTSAFVLRHNHVYRSTECFVHCLLVRPLGRIGVVPGRFWPPGLMFGTLDQKGLQPNCF